MPCFYHRTKWNLQMFFFIKIGGTVRNVGELSASNRILVHKRCSFLASLEGKFNLWSPLHVFLFLKLFFIIKSIQKRKKSYSHLPRFIVGTTVSLFTVPRCYEMYRLKMEGLPYNRSFQTTIGISGSWIMDHSNSIKFHISHLGLQTLFLL